MVSLLRKALFAGLTLLYTLTAGAITLSVNDGGTWRPTPVVSVNDGGTWRNVRLISVNDAGTWRPVHNVTYHNITVGTGIDYGYTSPSTDDPSGPFGSIDNDNTAFYIVGGSVIAVRSNESNFQVTVCGNSSYVRLTPFVRFWAKKADGTWYSVDTSASTYQDNPTRCANFGNVGGSWTWFSAGPWGAGDLGAVRMFVAEAN
jgi:hypothetical protein